LGIFKENIFRESKYIYTHTHTYKDVLIYLIVSIIVRPRLNNIAAQRQRAYWRRNANIKKLVRSESSRVTRIAKAGFWNSYLDNIVVSIANYRIGIAYSLVGCLTNSWLTRAYTQLTKTIEYHTGSPRNPTRQEMDLATLVYRVIWTEMEDKMQYYLTIVFELYLIVFQLWDSNLSCSATTQFLPFYEDSMLHMREREEDCNWTTKFSLSYLL